MLKISHKKLVLCINAQYLLAGIWQRGQLQSCQKFVNNEAGHDAFAEFLQQNPAMLMYLLVDTVTEDYRLEQLPHCTGRARIELIARKLGQFYRGLNYRAAHFIKRESNPRKDDLFLFVALNNDDFLLGWLAKIQTAEAHLVGIYLLPMLSEILLKRLKITSPRIMFPHILFCEKLSSGLRQTYLHDGSLRMSRLAISVQGNIPITDDQWENFYLAETEKTRLYLISQRFISSETVLSLVLVNQASSADKVSLKIDDRKGFTFTEVNLEHLSKQFNLPLDLVAQNPELLHMQLLQNAPALANLVPKNLTKHYQLSQIKRLIKIATVLIALLGLVASAWIFLQGWQYKLAFNQATQDTVIQLKNYDAEAKNFPATTLSADYLKAAVNLYNTINSYPKSPKRLMLAVSAGLAQTPEIKLERLRWVFTSDLNIKDDDKLLTDSATNNHFKQTTTPEYTTQDATQDATKNTAKFPHEIGFITATISNFNGDYRGALNSVHHFVAALNKSNTVAEVSILQAPVNLSSNADLQGSTQDEQATQQAAALFKLKIMLKTPDLLEMK